MCSSDLWLRSGGQDGGGILGASLLGLGVLGAAGSLAGTQAQALQRQAPSPAPEAMADLRGRVGKAPITLLVMPGSPDLNEQTLTTYGRLAGGQIEARRLGRNPREHPVVLERSDWLLLATGDQGTTHPASRELSHRIRADGRFERLAHAALERLGGLPSPQVAADAKGPTPPTAAPTPPNPFPLVFSGELPPDALP